MRRRNLRVLGRVLAALVFAVGLALSNGCSQCARCNPDGRSKTAKCGPDCTKDCCKKSTTAKACGQNCPENCCKKV